MSRSITIWWLLVAAWAANMFWMSTGTFGTDRSRPVLEQLLALFGIHLSPAVFKMIHTAMRKLAHVGEYSVLSFLVYRAIVGRSEWQLHTARWCFALCMFYSLTDEFHQVFVSNRGASLVDCGIDAVGVTVGVLLIYGINTRRYMPDF